MMTIGLFSFFAGAGFLDFGFEKTPGFEIVFVNEIHQPFLDAYKYSRNRMNILPPLFGYLNCDINLFTDGTERQELVNYVKQANLKYDVVGFIGGPPCPDFSIGGKNKGKHGENGTLSKTYTDIVCDCKPDFFLFENVKGLYRTKKHREFFESLKKQFMNAGYCLDERLVNSISYGAPQDRERILLFGVKGKSIGKFNWDLYLKFSKEDITKAHWPDKDTFIEGSITAKPDNIIDELTVQYWFDKNDVTSHENAIHCFQPRAGLSKFRIIQEGDDSKKSYKRLHRWRYSPTAAYGNNEVHLHPYKARRINVAEALSIQSLPKDFALPSTMSLTNMFKTIGNGVPYILSKSVASQIKQFYG